MSTNLQDLVASAFSIVGTTVQNSLKTVTYLHQTASGTYNPTTDVVTATTTTYNLSNAILTGIKDREKTIEFASTGKRGTKVTPEIGDVKLLIPYKSLPITPTNQDKVTINGVVWEVIGYQVDPTQLALLTILIRSA